MRSVSMKAVLAFLLFVALATLALCPFAVALHGLLGGDPSSFGGALESYGDFGLFIGTLASCLEDGELRFCLLFVAVVLAALLLGTAGNGLFVQRGREVEDGILGDQRVFAKKKDVLKRNYSWSGEGEPPVSGVAVGGYEGRMILAPANHAAIAAPSGSAKTRGSVYETVDALTYSAANSLIVTDPSGEIYAMMAGGLEKRGYEVCLLDLNKGRRGSRYNPLFSIRQCFESGDLSGAEARAREIGDVLCPESGGENDFFTRSAGGILSAVCYRIATDEEVPDGLRSLWSVIQTVAKGTRGGADGLKGYIAKHGEEDAAYMMAQTFMTAGDKVENSILASLNDALAPFSSEDMKYLTSSADLTVSQPMERPTAVFLRTLPKGSQANKLASLFLSQHLSETLRRGDRSSMLPVYVVGDEFHALPKFDVVTAVEQGRKFGLHYYMYVQSLTAFDAYSTGGENGREAILANCDVKALYKAGTESDARYFEVLGGKRTIRTRNEGTSKTAQSATDSEGYSEREVLNWPQGELLARDPVEDGICVFANIHGEGGHNGKFEIPVPDVTLTPTAANFPTFGSREHEGRVIRGVEEELDRRAAGVRFAPVAWTPDFGDGDDGEAPCCGDEDVFGL